MVSVDGYTKDGADARFVAKSDADAVAAGLIAGPSDTNSAVDGAVAAYMAALDSALRAATDAAFGPVAILNPETAQGDAVAQVAAARLAVGAAGMITMVDARGNRATPRPASWQGAVLWLISAGDLNPLEIQAGDLVAVSRDGFDPLTVPGLVGMWDANTLSLSDGTGVTTWGNAIPGAPASTGSGNAVYRAAGLNGFPAVEFEGVSGSVMRSDLYDSYDGITHVYCVGHSTPSSPSGTRFFFDATPSASSTYMALGLARNGSNDYVLYRGGTSGTVAGADNLPHVFHATFKPDSTAQFAIDGITVGSVGTGFIDQRRYTIGARSDGTGGQTLIGFIGCVMVIRGDVTPELDQKITAWLTERWGL